MLYSKYCEHVFRALFFSIKRGVYFYRRELWDIRVMIKLNDTSKIDKEKIIQIK